MSTVLIEPNPGHEPAAEPTRLIAVERGIPGFPELSEFAITPIDEYSMFVWLAAPSSEDVAFLAVNPFVCFPDYVVEVTDVDEAALCVEPGDDLIVYCLVTINRDGGDRGDRVATANLMAPIVINMTRAVAQQVILVGENDLRAMLPRPESAD